MNTFKIIALVRGAVIVVCSLILACSSSPRFVRNGGGSGSAPAKGGTSPSTASSGSVRPSSGKILLTLEGVASYYAHDFHGKLTSNGETFDMNDLTAAHRTFPFGTKIRVTNLNNQKTVIVRVNDRGPFVDGRIIDLSMGAAKAIGSVETGTTRVRLEVLQWGDGK
jgi:rare lipoprotein A